MTLGLSPADWQLIQKLAIVPIKQAGCQVWAFGSRVKGTHKKFSDLDLCFERSTALRPGFLSDLRESLENSSLPVKIDLVDWSDMAVEYRDEIFSHRILL